MRDLGYQHKRVWLRIGASVALGLVVVTGEIRGQEGAPAAPMQDATAKELLTGGYTSYGAGKFEESIGFYQKFITDFGKSADALMAMPQILPIMAMSQIRLEKWADASETIELFLSQYTTKAPPAEVENMKFWEAVCLVKQDNGEDARGKFEAFIAAYPRST